MTSEAPSCDWEVAPSPIGLRISAVIEGVAHPVAGADCRSIGTAQFQHRGYDWAWNTRLCNRRWEGEKTVQYDIYDGNCRNNRAVGPVGPYQLTSDPSTSVDVLQKIRTIGHITANEGVAATARTINDHLKYIESPVAIVTGVVPRPAIVDVLRYRWKYGLAYSRSIEVATNGERTILEDSLDEIEADDVFYDVGAGEGEYSLTIAQLLDSPSDVVAFEPSPAVQSLKRAAAKNGYDMQIFEKGVGTTEDSGFYRTYRNGRVSITTDPEEANDGIAVLDSDDIVDRDVPLPSVVKIDVNGWELDVLNAFRPLLKRDECRLVYIEIEPPSTDTAHRHPPIHDLRDSDLEKYFDLKWSFDEMVMLLTRAGFKCEYLMDSSGDIFIKAFK